jgi:hypothetical protein
MRRRTHIAPWLDEPRAMAAVHDIVVAGAQPDSERLLRFDTDCVQGLLVFGRLIGRLIGPTKEIAVSTGHYRPSSSVRRWM